LALDPLDDRDLLLEEELELLDRRRDDLLFERDLSLLLFLRSEWDLDLDLFLDLIGVLLRIGLRDLLWGHLRGGPNLRMGSKRLGGLLIGRLLILGDNFLSLFFNSTIITSPSICPPFIEEIAFSASALFSYFILPWPLGLLGLLSMMPASTILPYAPKISSKWSLLTFLVRLVIINSLNSGDLLLVLFFLGADLLRSFDFDLVLLLVLLSLDLGLLLSLDLVLGLLLLGEREIERERELDFDLLLLDLDEELDEYEREDLDPRDFDLERL